jgi:hypothetical protein
VVLALLETWYAIAARVKMLARAPEPERTAQITQQASAGVAVSHTVELSNGKRDTARIVFAQPRGPGSSPKRPSSRVVSQGASSSQPARPVQASKRGT